MTVTRTNSTYTKTPKRLMPRQYVLTSVDISRCLLAKYSAFSWLPIAACALPKLQHARPVDTHYSQCFLPLQLINKHFTEKHSTFITVMLHPPLLLRMWITSWFMIHNHQCNFPSHATFQHMTLMLHTGEITRLKCWASQFTLFTHYCLCNQMWNRWTNSVTIPPVWLTKLNRRTAKQKFSTY